MSNRTAISIPGSIPGVHYPRSSTTTTNNFTTSINSPSSTITQSANGIWTSSASSNGLTSKKIYPDPGATEYSRQQEKSNGVSNTNNNNSSINTVGIEIGGKDGPGFEGGSGAVGVHHRRTGSASPSLISTTNSPPASARSLVPASGANNIGATSKLNPSFYAHLMKLERWAQLIGANLLASKYALDPKGRWRAVGHAPVLIYLIRAFLLLSLLREFVVGLAVDASDHQLMLYTGDFGNIYGVHVDRFAFNAFKVCWGLHATVIYWWISRGNGRIRAWLAAFEARWLETAYYVNEDLENKSLEKMRAGRKFATAFVQITSSIATFMVTSLNVYGYLYNDDHNSTGENVLSGENAALIYFSWCLAHMIWFWLTFVINMTAFGHHFLLCRAIHIRFDETKKDLEYAILSEASSATKPEHISGLITKHYYVCEMVKQANRHLKVYLFIFYTIFAPHLCLMIYQIMFSTNATTQGKIFIGFLLILSDFFQVYSVSVLSAQITTKSHEPYYAMHGVNKFDGLPENVQLQSTLFMQRISNTVVGLTILDSFILTGGLISSLVTAIVTYFSVILESA